MPPINNPLQVAKSLVPVLTSGLYKGQCGKIGVIGGCLEYTGAPYYSAFSALKCGADLAHIFCAKDAGVAIKSYSPELIVLPVLLESHQIGDSSISDVASKIKEWMERLTAIIIGPGMGRDPSIMETIAELIQHARTIEIPLILDGDALWLIKDKKHLVKDNKHCVLLPNPMEFKRLQTHENQTVKELAEEMGVLIVEKGEKDKIVYEKLALECGIQNGSKRRCGGQGDLLSGLMGTFMSWENLHYKRQKEENPIDDEERATLKVSAAYAACFLLKRCGKRAFQKHGRSTTTVEMIKEIGPTFRQLFDSENASLV